MSLSEWLGGELEVGVGLDYSEGDYDEAVDTRAVFVPLSVAYRFDELALTPTRRDQLELKVTVPYLWIEGAITAGDTRTRSEEGIGDVVLGAAYLYYPKRRYVPAFELAFDTKLPTADEDEGLGTGRTDYALRATFFQRYGDVVPFVSGGYRFIGENEPDFQLRDGATAGVGLSWLVTPRFGIGASYDWRESISKRSEPDNDLVRAEDAHEITFFGSGRFGSGLRVAPYWVVGLADGSPNFAVGLQLKITLPVRPQPDPGRSAL